MTAKRVAIAASMLWLTMSAAAKASVIYYTTSNNRPIYLDSIDLLDSSRQTVLNRNDQEEFARSAGRSLAIDPGTETAYFIGTSLGGTSSGIAKVNLDGTGFEIIGDFPSQLGDVELDVGIGRIFMTRGDKRIVSTDLSGNNEKLLVDPNLFPNADLSLRGLALDSVSQQVYFLTEGLLNGEDADTVWKVDYDGTNLEQIFTFNTSSVVSIDLNDIEIDFKNRLLIWGTKTNTTLGADTRIQTFNLGTGEVVDIFTFFAGVSEPKEFIRQLYFDPIDELLYWTGSDLIRRISLSGQDLEIIADTALFPDSAGGLDPYGIALGPAVTASPPVEVPEPPTLALYTIGLAGLGVMCWWRKRCGQARAV